MRGGGGGVEWVVNWRGGGLQDYKHISQCKYVHTYTYIHIHAYTCIVMFVACFQGFPTDLVDDMLQPSVDATAWQMEVERVLPHLKVTIRNDHRVSRAALHSTYSKSCKSISLFGTMVCVHMYIRIPQIPQPQLITIILCIHMEYLRGCVLYTEHVLYGQTGQVSAIKGQLRKYSLLSEVLTISVVFSTVHEVGREQGALTISVVFSTVHEVGRESKEYLISVLFSVLYMR